MRRSISFLGLGLVLCGPGLALAQDPSVPNPKDRPKGERRLEDVPETFVPRNPRTTDERDRIEAVRLYAAARSLEDRHQLNEALETLEKARKISPESPTILRALSRLNLLLGRTDQAVAVARKLIEIEPNDTAMITLLVSHFLERKNDPAGAEATLKKIAANPKLDKASAGYYMIQRLLGDLYADVLNRPADAAAAFLRLTEALDAKAANALSPRDRQRVLDGDEATSYVRFGEVFLRAKMYAAAVQAFRRGLVYKVDHPTLPRLLADALAKVGERAEALAVLEAYLKRQPSGSESYDLLGDILDGMGRSGEVLPRLESAAKADSKNLRLQFLLAERLRAEGKGDRADELLAELLKKQGEPQVYAALAQSYKKEKKADDLVRILGEAFERTGGPEAVQPTIRALVDDPEMIGRVLDAGVRMISAKPPTLTPKTRQLLMMMAREAKQNDKLIALDVAAMKAAPSATNQKQLIDTYFIIQKYDAASAALQELFAKYPAEKNGQTLMLLAQSQFFAGKQTDALETAKLARIEGGDDARGLGFLAVILSQLNRDDEAIVVYEDILKKFSGDDEAVKRARSGLSVCYVNKGDFTRGEAELEILFRKEPEDPGINNDLGYLYADQGKNLEKAEGMIRKALEEEPDNGSYLDSLGWCLFKRGKMKEALEPLEKAYRSKNNDLTICEHLGDVYFHMKDFAKAREAWIKAEEFASKTTPPSKKLPEVRKKLAELEKLGPAPKPAGPDGP
jgi:tetratricopeptide (TPR) repeat protein